MVIPLLANQDLTPMVCKAGLQTALHYCCLTYIYIYIYNTIQQKDKIVLEI